MANGTILHFISTNKYRYDTHIIFLNFLYIESVLNFHKTSTKYRLWNDITTDGVAWITYLVTLWTEEKQIENSGNELLTKSYHNYQPILLVSSLTNIFNRYYLTD